MFPESKDMNYDQMDQEHQRILGLILAHESNSFSEPTDKMTVGIQAFPLERPKEYIDDPE